MSTLQAIPLLHVVQVWDLIIHISEEMACLWIGKLTFVKVLYFGSRYLMLAAQVVNQALSFHFEDNPSKRYMVCPGLYVYRAVMAQVGLSLIEVILFIRVYALYNRSPKIAAVILGFFIASMSFEVVGSGLVNYGLAKVRDCTTYPKASKIGLIVYGVGAAISQLVVFTMTSGKFISGGRTGESRTPLTSLLLREGVVTFILIFAVLMAAICSDIKRRSDTFDPKAGRAAFAWYITILSVSGSRLILNMRKLGIQSPHEDDSQIREGGDSMSSVYLSTIFEE